jgi:type II secretory pathway component PulK
VTSTLVDVTLPAMFHTSVTLERARQVTRAKKRKQTLANIKKKAERLKKHPKPIAKKVEIMLRTKGLWGQPKPIR